MAGATVGAPAAGGLASGGGAVVLDKLKARRSAAQFWLLASVLQENAGSLLAFDWPDAHGISERRQRALLVSSEGFNGLVGVCLHGTPSFTLGDAWQQVSGALEAPSSLLHALSILLKSSPEGGHDDGRHTLLVRSFVVAATG